MVNSREDREMYAI